MRSHFAFLVLAAAPVVAGCGLIDPSDVTDDIKDNLPQEQTTLQISAIADGSGKTKVSVCASDGIVCTDVEGPFQASIAGGAPVDLAFVTDYTEKNGKKVGQFKGTVEGDTAGAKINVTRGAAKNSPSTAVLPEAAMITAPTEGTSISLATDTLKLTWSPSASQDRIEWTSGLECPSKSADPALIGTNIDDTGELALDAAKLGLPDGETCTVTLVLRKSRNGAIEPAFNGKGLITATQERRVSFTVAP